MVAELSFAMDTSVSIPITVKCRIGFPGKESLDDLCKFIDCVRQTGVQRFIVHA